MDMIEKVKSIVAAQLRLEPESIADDASLIEDLGADSLDLVDIVMAFESEFDTTVSEEEFSELRTIKDLADYISARI
ncbi:MAG: acyl carrier protein [Clostridia bacterium]|nr:acyl carrier protein [Clostridia bacterium]MBO7215448.1 acyl carrier protein [Clostridia bacterium]MBO7246311.1 acyl carrier protein [Clostridia bacterium]MBO7738324.1 acyl carrier protein [Clostridia bacterium]